MSDVFIVNAMRPEDYGATCRLLTGVFNGYAARIGTDLRKKYTLVARKNAKIVGAAQYVPIGNCGEKMGDGFSLRWLGVDADCRHRGIGRTLVNNIEDAVRKTLRGKKGFIGLSDYTKRKNSSSRFYEDIGYAARDIGPLRDGNGDIVLVKLLNAGLTR